MSAFLWTMVVVAAANTVAVIFCGLLGRVPPVTPGSRVIDAIWTASMGAWALWLIAKGAA